MPGETNEVSWIKLPQHLGARFSLLFCAFSFFEGPNGLGGEMKLEQVQY